MRFGYMQGAASDEHPYALLPQVKANATAALTAAIAKQRQKVVDMQELVAKEAAEVEVRAGLSWPIC